MLLHCVLSVMESAESPQFLMLRSVFYVIESVESAQFLMMLHSVL
jgi:hypothetical protein